MDGYGNRFFSIIKFVVLVGLVMKYLRNMRTGEIENEESAGKANVKA